MHHSPLNNQFQCLCLATYIRTNLNNLITIWSSEAAAVPVEGAHVPLQEVVDGEGGGHSLSPSLPDLVHVRKQAGQTMVRLVRHLPQVTAGKIMQALDYLKENCQDSQTVRSSFL